MSHVDFFWKTSTHPSLFSRSHGRFATTLVDRLRANMIRLRLGGRDPILVYDKAIREAMRIHKPQLDDDCQFGLRMVIEHHSTGLAIKQLLERRVAKTQ